MEYLETLIVITRMKDINYKKIAIVVLSILVIPFLGNLFWPGWNWTISDFITFGAISYFVGILINIANLKLKSPITKVIGTAVVVFPFLFLWVLIVSDGELIPRILSWF